jgi:hypothetical protein
MWRVPGQPGLHSKTLAKENKKVQYINKIIFPSFSLGTKTNQLQSIHKIYMFTFQVKVNLNSVTVKTICKCAYVETLIFYLIAKGCWRLSERF